MLKVIAFKTEKIVGNVNHIRAEIAVDSASDLATECASGVFTQGSIAWDIETGDFYGLDSSGEWVKQ